MIYARINNGVIEARDDSWDGFDLQKTLSDGFVSYGVTSVDWLYISNGSIAVHTQAEMDATALSVARTKKIAELKASYQLSVTGTFQSSALGASHTYEAGMKSRTDLLGAKQVATDSGSSVDFECVDDSTGQDVFAAHTAAQFSQVLADGAAKAVADKQNLLTKLSDVNAATDVATVQSITF